MVAVLAGCGDLGTQVGLRLAATGRDVLGLRRHPERLPAPIRGQAVDLATERPLLPADTELVVIATTADARTPDGYRTAYLDVARNVLAATDAPVLFVSSTSVYAVSDGSWIDENTPAEPTSPTATVLRAAEELVTDRGNATVLRLAGLYGPGRGRLLAGIRAGTTTIPATPTYTNRIHRDDAAAAIVHLTTAVPRPAPVYLGADHLPTDRGTLLRFVADLAGLPHPPVSRDPVSGKGRRCHNTALCDTGFTFTYPTFREGYRAVIG